jgi:hypothetical protein
VTCEIIQASLAHQDAVRRIVHQYAQTQLTTANQCTANEKSQRIRPTNKNIHANADDKPSMQHQQATDQVRALAQHVVISVTEFDVHVGEVCVIHG